VKNCLFCKKFQYFSGTPHYSEATPGSNVEMRCNVLVRGQFLWEFHYLDSEDEFRANMTRAKTCEHYEQREEINES